MAPVWMKIIIIPVDCAQGASEGAECQRDQAGIIVIECDASLIYYFKLIIYKRGELREKYS